MEDKRKSSESLQFTEEQKKAENFEIKNNIYNQLYLEIFLPLSEGIIEFSEGFYFMLTLRWDIYGIYQSTWFEHALKHLILDINDFENRFKKLQKNFNEYDKNFRNFEKDLEDLVKSYFIENAFEIYEPSNSRHDINAVYITYELIDRLKNHWKQKEKIQINHRWEGNILKVSVSTGDQTLGTFSDDRKKDIIDCLYNIKNYKQILDKFNNIAKCLDEIITDQENLCKDIKKNIIMKMSIGVYNTSCEDCKEYLQNK